MKREAHEYIYTHTGLALYPEDITAQDIRLEDIAYSLGGIYRYNGHTRITVLRHSLGLADYFKDASPTHILYALLHDAAEAYMMDVPVPMKRFVTSEWREQLWRIENLIFDKFIPHLNNRALDEVLSVDKELVKYEMRTAGYEPGSGFKYPLPIDKEIYPNYFWPIPDKVMPEFYLKAVRRLL